MTLLIYLLLLKTFGMFSIGNVLIGILVWVLHVAFYTGMMSK